jgi:hypothetical protein
VEGSSLKLANLKKKILKASKTKILEENQLRTTFNKCKKKAISKKKKMKIKHKTKKIKKRCIKR